MKSDVVYLRHILDAIEKIEGYTRVGEDAFIRVLKSSQQKHKKAFRPSQIGPY